MLYQYQTAHGNFIKPIPVEHTKDWYVLHVSPLKEKCIKDIIDSEFNSGIETIIFTKEVLHKKGTKYVSLVTPIFPGYIFVKDRVAEVVDVLQKHAHDFFFKAVSFGNGPAKIAKDEMQLLLLYANEGGKFDMSYGFKEGEHVCITHGPLKNIQGSIVFINEKKRKAKVKLMLFKKEMEISLGVELLRKSQALKATSL